MRDSRGVDRGRCTQCPCAEFQQSAGESVRCSCGHSPTKHDNLSAPSPPSLEPSVDHVVRAAIGSAVHSTASATVATSFQDVTAPTLCALPNCEKPALFDPNTGESRDVCKDHIDYSSDMNNGLPQFPGLAEHFQYMNMDGGQAIPTGQKHISKAPKCSNPLCSRSCYFKDGTYFDYCGKTCRNEYLRSRTLVTTDGEAVRAPQCSNPSCSRTCYPKPDGTYFDYCGQSCRNECTMSKSQGIAPVSLCSLPGCKLPQDSQGRYDGYCGHSHKHRALVDKVVVELDSEAREFQQVARTFTRQWIKPELKPAPTNLKIFKVYNPTLESQFLAYTQSLGQPSKEQHFHGTTLRCDLTSSKIACKHSDCGICGICRRGFDHSKIGSNISRFKRFGMGIYLAPNSSKCHDYTQGHHDYRALLLCDVAPGRKYMVTQDKTTLKSPPQGYDSVYGKHGGRLNYDEIVLYDKNAILPKYVILYQKDGVKQIAK